VPLNVAQLLQNTSWPVYVGTKVAIDVDDNETGWNTVLVKDVADKFPAESNLAVVVKF